MSFTVGAGTTRRSTPRVVMAILQSVGSAALGWLRTKRMGQGAVHRSHRFRASRTRSTSRSPDQKHPVVQTETVDESAFPHEHRLVNPVVVRVTCLERRRHPEVLITEICSLSLCE